MTIYILSRWYVLSLKILRTLACNDYLTVQSKIIQLLALSFLWSKIIQLLVGFEWVVKAVENDLAKENM